ncbi:Metalloendopeptidase [Aphelenchoides bicaudatus]|nr:Metalloendopeptidase [Aphelenchoides bicaudatus]
MPTMRLLSFIVLVFPLASAEVTEPPSYEANTGERAFYETNTGSDLIYGDIMMTQRDKFVKQLPKNVRMSLFVKNSGFNRWPNNIVPIEISNQYSAFEQQTIRKALRELEQKTCFRFPGKSVYHMDYVVFEPRQGCNSPLGRQGGKQVVSLGASCVQNYIIIHETMHVLGIHIAKKNVDPRNRQWLEPVTYNNFDTQGFAYDINSVMHYHGTAFGRTLSTNPISIATTMTIKNTRTPVPVNQFLTEQDIKKIQSIGNCPTNNAHPILISQPNDRSPRRNKNRRMRHW